MNGYQKTLTLLTWLFYSACIFAQPKTDSLLENLLKRQPDSLMQRILAHPETYHLQVIYTQINRDRHNRPTFRNYYYQFDPAQYFNPASTVKLPLAFLALEKLNTMRINGVNKYTPIQYDSAYPAQTKEYTDSSSENKLPSIAHFIKKAFLVSDNDAFNRLYEFLGQEYINSELHKKGYEDAQLLHRLQISLSAEENRFVGVLMVTQWDETQVGEFLFAPVGDRYFGGALNSVFAIGLKSVGG